jgi:3-methyladenine DNA glycosylase AlkD
MTAKEVLTELKSLGTESTKKTLANHGAPDTQYGVKIEELKKIQKKIKKNYELSLYLYNSGISDAQYLAGLIADEKQMTKKDLQHWAETASWHMQSEYTVPWIAAESDHGWSLALQWIDSKKESIQSSGWTTLASLVAIKKDEEFNIKELKIYSKEWRKKFIQQVTESVIQ